MKKELEIIRITRTNFLAMIEGLTIGEINTIPAGFNNNIIWNLGHVIAVQQVLCYERSGLGSQPALKGRFGKGTRPGTMVDEAELATLKQLLMEQCDQLRKDLGNGSFTGRSYEALTASYGVHMASIEEAIAYLVAHEALHYGYAMSQKRALAGSQV